MQRSGYEVNRFLLSSSSSCRRMGYKCQGTGPYEKSVVTFQDSSSSSTQYYEYRVTIEITITTKQEVAAKTKSASCTPCTVSPGSPQLPLIFAGRTLSPPTALFPRHRRSVTTLQLDPSKCDGLEATEDCTERRRAYAQCSWPLTGRDVKQ